MNFEDLRLSEPILRAVAAEGYSTPTPVQRESIPHILEGRDLLGCAQTGTGKTAAFALPTLQRLSQSAGTSRGQRTRPIRALVLCPTRELASQIGDAFRTYGRHCPLRHAVVFGGVSQGHQVRSIQQGVDIIVATPGRLQDLMGQGYIDLRNIEVLILDEADRMLDMGFLPDIRRIERELPKKRQTLFFSATMPGPIRALADTILRNPASVQVDRVASAKPVIEQSVYLVNRPQKSALLRHLLQNESMPRTLVFTRTKHGADRVVKDLNRAGIEAMAIHGNKSQNARTRALGLFKSAKPPVLVATDIASRGIDVDDVTHVVNFDVPHEAETYVHRIGRTGRAGMSGVAISFCDRSEQTDLRSIERLIGGNLRKHGDLPKLPEAPPVASRSRPVSRGEQRFDHDGDGLNMPRKPRRKKRSWNRAGKPASANPGGDAARARPARDRDVEQTGRPKRRRPGIGAAKQQITAHHHPSTSPRASSRSARGKKARRAKQSMTSRPR